MDSLVALLGSPPYSIETLVTCFLEYKDLEGLLGSDYPAWRQVLNSLIDALEALASVCFEGSGECLTLLDTQEFWPTTLDFLPSTIIEFKERLFRVSGDDPTPGVPMEDLSVCQYCRWGLFRAVAGAIGRSSFASKHLAKR
jgi:hypothetical protein